MGAEVPAEGPYQEFATELRRLRKAAGLTQVQLAERTMETGDPIPQGQVSQYESGDCGISDRRTATLSTVLGAGSELWEARRRDAMGGEGVTRPLSSVVSICTQPRPYAAQTLQHAA